MRVGFGIVLGLAVLLGLGGRIGAQASGHGRAPVGSAPAATDRPHPGLSMAARMEEPIPDAGVPAATESRGAQPLPSRLDNGVTVFELTAQPVKMADPASVARPAGRARHGVDLQRPGSGSPDPSATDHHVTNDDREPGGLVFAIKVAG